MIQHQFRDVATAAGRAVGGTGDTGYETWLIGLWERLKPLKKDEYFSEQHVLSTRPKSREIPLSRIDSPPKKQGAERRGETRFAGLDPSERIAAVARSGYHMVVVPGPRRRYVVALQDRAIYAAYVELCYTSAPCVVKARGRRLSMEAHTVDERVIDRVCRASMDLCALLETEALAEGSKQQELQGDRSPSVVGVGQNIARLRFETGFSYEELASIMGVEKKTVWANASGRTMPRPQTLKLYADAFSRGLGRPVSVAEIRGTTDD